LFSWWENIGLQVRFMVIASVGLLTLAVSALAVVGWYEFSSFEERLRTFSENELRSLNSLVESAMERRPGDQQNVAIKVFNGWFENRNKEYAGKLWSVWSPKTRAYVAGTALERAPKMPLDAIDEEALRTGRPVGHFVGNTYRYSIPIIQGSTVAARKEVCATCHTALMGENDGEVIAVLSSSLTTTGGMAALHRSLMLLAGGAFAAVMVVMFAIRTTLGRVTTRERSQTLALIASRNSLALTNAKLLEEGARRERIEEQFRQSQKMESLGQLTGGIAHDFNNMLAVIIGNLNILKRRISRGEGGVDQFIDYALTGAERAALLTHRLLAFSRQQPLTPEVVYINKFVAGMSEMLRRTLGENLRMETILTDSVWRTYVDPSQLENAILNLAVNARDAMPDGGRLTIETGNAHLDDNYAATHADVAVGQYAMVAVSDTGVGMPREVIVKAFDPFFTTKAVGKGTGLGLSQVYGFVKQSGGHVDIYSEPGQGTTIKLYLPRFLGAGVSVAKSQTANMIPTGTAQQIILVVEDEAEVRQSTADTLRELGYTVIAVDGAAAALRVLDAHPDLSLLFTDVVMQDMNGWKLADEARRRRPNLKVLYTSGYTRDAIVHNGALDAGVQLISKPFTLEQLALKIREALTD
jgi:signal transduction histidine kinase/ActR/RegA family two-component response regulator